LGAVRAVGVDRARLGAVRAVGVDRAMLALESKGHFQVGDHRRQAHRHRHRRPGDNQAMVLLGKKERYNRPSLSTMFHLLTVCHNQYSV
jgi:hypothetical protein